MTAYFSAFKHFTMPTPLLSIIVGLMITLTELPVLSQAKGIWTPEVGLYLGRVIKHNKRFTIPITEPSFLFEASLYQWKNGQEDWHHSLLYPQIGLSAQYVHFGDSDILGRGVSIIPNVILATGRSSERGLTIRLGMGLAYLTRPYDVINNPGNIAIGSNINNVTNLYINYRSPIGANSYLAIGGGLTHFSNGKFKSPNVGVNILAAQLSYQYTLQPFKKMEMTTGPKSYPKHFAIYKFSMGAHDIGKGSPTHPVYLHNLAYAYSISKVSLLWMGMTYAFSRAEYHNMLFSGYNGNTLKKSDASDFSVLIGYELRIGKIGLMGQTGLYLYDPGFNSSPHYFKLGFNYYLFEMLNHLDVFVFTNIKSHLEVADYFELGVGLRLF